VTQARSVAAGHPEFLWQTQLGKRKRDPNAPKQRRQRYTKEQKEEMLTVLFNTPGAKIQDVAKQLGVPEGTLRGWYDENKRDSAQEMELRAATYPHEIDRNAEAANASISVIGGTGTPVDLANGEQQMIQRLPAGMPYSLHPMVEQVQQSKPEAPPKKKKRQRYSNETKIQVILALESRPNSLNEVAKEFGVATGTVRGWREEADKIQKQAMENRRVGAKANPSKDPLKKIWDSILRLFELNSRLPISQQLDVNVAVVRTIGVQARDIMLHQYKTNPEVLTDNEYNSFQKFKASETWARKWSKDHQVTSSKPKQNPIDAAHDRVAVLQRIVVGYQCEHVYTMTTSSLFYRILPHRTYVSVKEQEQATRACKGLKAKDRLTLYICSNETGSDKLPLTCIGKYENPACFQVNAQRTLPYLSQKQALSDAGTFQKWWRSIFLPHIRSRYTESEAILLLVDTDGPCKAELLKDPTGQVRVEALPLGPNPNPIAGGQEKVQESGKEDQGSGVKIAFPPCQPMELGVTETIKRRYRYRLLQEVMDAFDERVPRRKIADNANFSIRSRGLREGSPANLCDAMRLLEGIWAEVANTTIIRSWESTKLRTKSALPPELEQKPGTRAKSEKRQNTREKKQLVKNLTHFLSKHESRNLADDDGANQLDEMVEKLKNCFLYTDGEVIEEKEMLESLENWVCLEDNSLLVNLFRDEIKEEMNIAYLVGLKEMKEASIPDAEEPEEPELEEWKIEKNNAKEEELDVDTAMELAGTIKATAVKLFGNGNILGHLAVKLDEASDSVFRLLRKQKEDAAQKKEMEITKSAKKKAALPPVPPAAPIHHGDGIYLGDLGDLGEASV
jgi:transposase-like protein